MIWNNNIKFIRTLDRDDIRNIREFYLKNAHNYTIDPYYISTQEFPDYTKISCAILLCNTETDNIGVEVVGMFVKTSDNKWFNYIKKTYKNDIKLSTYGTVHRIERLSNAVELTFS